MTGRPGQAGRFLEKGEMSVKELLFTFHMSGVRRSRARRTTAAERVQRGQGLVKAVFDFGKWLGPWGPPSELGELVMTARPRFFLLPGISVMGATHRADVELSLGAVSVSAADGAATVGWRLLGGNNRELGRSAQVHSTHTILAEIDRVQSAAERLSIVVSKSQTGKWYWTASADGRRLAMSARTYGRQRECRYNAEQFLRALPIAAPPRPSSTTERTRDSAGAVVA